MSHKMEAMLIWFKEMKPLYVSICCTTCYFRELFMNK